MDSAFLKRCPYAFIFLRKTGRRESLPRGRKSSRGGAASLPEAGKVRHARRQAFPKRERSTEHAGKPSQSGKGPPDTPASLPKAGKVRHARRQAFPKRERSATHAGNPSRSGKGPPSTPASFPEAGKVRRTRRQVFPKRERSAGSAPFSRRPFNPSAPWPAADGRRRGKAKPSRRR